MKKYFLPSALILIVGLGFALAQNITKSVQLSQDGSGTIGYDTSNNVYFPAHVLNSALAGAPVATSSAGTVTATGSDFAGTVVGGSAAVQAVTLLFKTAYLASPFCVLTVQNPSTSPLAYNAVTTGINITTAMGASTANYVCSGSK